MGILYLSNMNVLQLGLAEKPQKLINLSFIVLLMFMLPMCAINLKP